MPDFFKVQAQLSTDIGIVIRGIVIRIQRERARLGTVIRIPAYQRDLPT